MTFKVQGVLIADFSRRYYKAIRVIDGFSERTGNVFAWLCIPLAIVVCSRMTGLGGDVFGLIRGDWLLTNHNTYDKGIGKFYSNYRY